MIKSIHLVLSFRNAKDAYKVAHEREWCTRWLLEKITYSKGEFPHVLIFKFYSEIVFSFDECDIICFRNGIPRNDMSFALRSDLYFTHFK